MTYEKLYYDGGWRSSTSGETTAVISSATELEVARVPRGTAEDVDRAVKAARRGFESWSRLPVEERAQWLEELSAAMKTRVPQIAEAIAPANYLNQPQIVLEQILTGTFADGLGSVQKVPNRVDFDPFPWESFAVWILTQMKRWGQIKGDVDYAGIAKQVFLATDTTKLMKEVGLTPPTTTTKSFVVMGKTFDPAKPEDYLASFKIKKSA